MRYFFIIMLMISTECFAASGVRPNAATATAMTDNMSIPADLPNSTTAIKVTGQGVSDYIQGKLSGVLAPATHVHPFANTSTATGGFMGPTDKTRLDALYSASVPNSATEGAVGDGTWHSLASQGYTVESAQAKWPYLTTDTLWTASGATITGTSDAMRVTSTGSDPIIEYPVTVTGASNNGTLVIRYRRVAGSGWDGFVLYRNTAWQYSVVSLGTAPTDTEWHTVTLDLATATVAWGTPLAWTGAAISSLRFDFGNSASDIFDVDYVSLNGVALTTNRHIITSSASLTSYGVDWAAIQSCVYASAAGSGLCQVAYGTYILERAISVAGTSVVGNNEMSATYRYTTNTSVIFQHSSTYTGYLFTIGSKSILRNLSLLSAAGYTGNITGYGINIISGSYNIKIENNNFSSLLRGINSNNRCEAIITENYFYNMYVSIYADGTSAGTADMRIYNNKVYNEGYNKAVNRKFVYVNSNILPNMVIARNDINYLEILFDWTGNVNADGQYGHIVWIQDNYVLGVAAGGAISAVTAIGYSIGMALDISRNIFKTSTRAMPHMLYPNGEQITYPILAIGNTSTAKITDNVFTHTEADAVEIYGTNYLMMITGNLSRLYSPTSSSGMLRSTGTGTASAVCLKNNLNNLSANVIAYPSIAQKGITYATCN